MDDLGNQSRYEDCLFWKNNLGGAFYGGARYELDIEDNARVTGCFFGGPILDPNHRVSKNNNTFDAPSPEFDALFVPQASAYQKAGYRPAVPPKK